MNQITEEEINDIISEIKIISTYLFHLNKKLYKKICTEGPLEENEAINIQVEGANISTLETKFKELKLIELSEYLNSIIEKIFSQYESSTDTTTGTTSIQGPIKPPPGDPKIYG